MSIKVIVCESGCCGKCHHDEPEEEKEVRRVASAYDEYVEVNGHHFSSKLADYASRRMRNMDKSNHHWTTEEVKEAFIMYGYKKSADCTWGDVCYSANMAYADYFGIVLKSEQDCLLYAVADVSDVDGYEGKIFCRWIADVEHSGAEIEWKDFI